MKAKCIENACSNTNFTLNKEYEVSKNGIRCDWGGMWIMFQDLDRPQSFNVGDVFKFGLCKFIIM